MAESVPSSCRSKAALWALIVCDGAGGEMVGELANGVGEHATPSLAACDVEADDGG